MFLFFDFFFFLKKNSVTTKLNLLRLWHLQYIKMWLNVQKVLFQVQWLCNAQCYFPYDERTICSSHRYCFIVFHDSRLRFSYVRDVWFRGSITFKYDQFLKIQKQKPSIFKRDCFSQPSAQKRFGQYILVCFHSIIYFFLYCVVLISMSKKIHKIVTARDSTHIIVALRWHLKKPSGIVGMCKSTLIRRQSWFIHHHRYKRCLFHGRY